MSPLSIWIALVGLTAATFITRAGFLLLGDRVSLPGWLERALRYAPACALAAIVVPELVYAQGRLNLSFENFRLLAACAAAAYFTFTRQLLGTILVGMAVYTALRLWAP